jgi:hypothetical protein
MMGMWTSRATGATGFVVASKAKEPDEPKRLNRAVGVSEALKGVLDSALKKRGFATRDILTHWAAMAPKPYDKVAVPDQLKWPRGAGHEGATLYLRCARGHALGLSHETALIASAVNRYFGYFLVREVKLSAEPFAATAVKPPALPATTPETERHVEQSVSDVEDNELKAALKDLGRAVLRKQPRSHVTKA